MVLEVQVKKGGRSIPEPQYETEEYSATTGFAETTDEVARKATRYMLDYLPHALVSMHMPREIFG